MPIALYPDALIATLLPASVYPLEIVQAARFVSNTNNVAKIDEQTWDESVKAIAKIPAALAKLNDDLPWTIQLGEAFLNQDKDVMDTIQALRMKAKNAGTLQSTEQQVVVVTNMVVETKVEQELVVVTNTVVQIQPSNPQVVYVPSYPPTVYAPPPSYVYDPWAPLITFGAGVAMGAIIANNCDWHGGGCYWGGGWGGGDVDIDVTRKAEFTGGDRTTVKGGSRKWQADPNRVRASGSGTSARTMESRGWGTGTGAGGARASTTAAGTGRPGAAAGTTRSSTASRPQTGTRAATGTRPSSPSSAGARPSGARTTASAAPARSSSPTAFSRAGGGADRQMSQRGAASRSGGSGMGGAGARGGGGRGGGRR